MSTQLFTETVLKPAGGYPYYKPSSPAIRSKFDTRAALHGNSELWDLYTLKADYSPGPNDAYKSYYIGDDPGSLLEPAVSKYLYGKAPAIDYPDGKPFAVCLSHDIDLIYPPLAHRAFSSLYHLWHGDLGRLKDEVLWKKGGKSSYDYRNFREIMALEDGFGARSTFYFLTAERNIQRLRMYDIAELEAEMGRIADRGWEVGLHGGYYSYDDPGAIREEKRRLEKVLGRRVTGYRNHYLRFKVPDTWEHLREAGFMYDSTLGYNDVPGFRNGMCHPFRPYNLKTGRELDILEIPLAIMDCALFGYAGSPGRAWEIAKGLIDVTEHYRGVITLLWHNDAFCLPYRAGWMALYEKILCYCRERNAWMASGDEISRHCEAYVC